MRVLITGATGLIGSTVADALLARGDEVVGLTRDVEKARPKNPTVNWHAWQPTTERPPPQALEGVDGVVNLIGEEINQRLTDEAKKRIRESRVAAARNLIQGIQVAETSRGSSSASRRSATTGTAARRSSTRSPSQARDSLPSCLPSGRPRNARPRTSACAR